MGYRRVHRVGSRRRILGHVIASRVDDVAVVPSTTGHRVRTRTAIEEIFAGACGEAVVPGEPVQKVAEGSSDERIGARSPAGEVGNVERSEEHTSELQSQSNLVCRL